MSEKKKMASSRPTHLDFHRCIFSVPFLAMLAARGPSEEVAADAKGMAHFVE